MNKNIFISIKEKRKSIGFVILFEAISSFSLIFIINFPISLGEIDIKVFNLVYNVNFFNAIWIGGFTMIAFWWMQKTNISSNILNLVISSRNRNINKKEFSLSIIGQFIGGILAALIVFLIVSKGIDHGDSGNLIMGGTTTDIKGLFLANPDMFNINSIWDPISFSDYGHGAMFGFAAMQGLVNSFAICIAFMLNRRVDNNFDNQKKVFALRYIILIVIISISTIIYANTTNWIRLLSPAIISQVNSWIDGDESIILWTTLIFMLFQVLGFGFVFFSRNHLDKEKNRGEKHGI